MRIPIILAAVLACLVSLPSLARPNLEEPMDSHILSQSSLPYGFSDFHLRSQDGKRGYHIWIATPHRPVPASGYPSLFLLDGNAALGALSEDNLKQLAEGSSLVLVIIGHDTPLRFDPDTRSYDFTLPTQALGPTHDSLTGSPTGGADHFLDWLDLTLAPELAKRVMLDPNHKAIWGHSYGGLLVLHALLTRPGNFRSYYAASPSLWWGNGQLLQEETGFDKRLADTPVCLFVLRGKDEPAYPSRLPAESASRVTTSTAEALTMRLVQTPGVSGQYREFEGLGHGAMFNRSLSWTLTHYSAGNACN